MNAVCAVDGCDGAVRARGWCSTHYQRWWRNGDPLTVIDLRKPLTEDDERHGTVNGYSNLRCRCDGCTEAWRGYCADTKRRRISQQAPTVHGRSSTYTNWGCRCVPCTVAHAEHQRVRRARKRQQVAS